MEIMNVCRFKDIKIHEVFLEKITDEYSAIFCKISHNKGFCIADNIESNLSLVGSNYFQWDDEFDRFYKLNQKYWTLENEN